MPKVKLFISRSWFADAARNIYQIGTPDMQNRHFVHDRGPMWEKYQPRLEESQVSTDVIVAL